MATGKKKGRARLRALDALRKNYTDPSADNRTDEELATVTKPTHRELQWSDIEHTTEAQGWGELLEVPDADTGEPVGRAALVVADEDDQVAGDPDSVARLLEATIVYFAPQLRSVVTMPTPDGTVGRPVLEGFGQWIADRLAMVANELQRLDGAAWAVPHDFAGRWSALVGVESKRAGRPRAAEKRMLALPANAWMATADDCRALLNAALGWLVRDGAELGSVGLNGIMGTARRDRTDAAERFAVQTRELGEEFAAGKANRSNPWRDGFPVRVRQPRPDRHRGAYALADLPQPVTHTYSFGRSTSEREHVPRLRDHVVVRDRAGQLVAIQKKDAQLGN